MLKYAHQVVHVIRDNAGMKRQRKLFIVHELETCTNETETESNQTHIE